MSGLEVLDVVIGLVFLYLLLSLACTAVNELIAQWWNTRASTLSEGISALLGGDAVKEPPSVPAAELRLEAATGDLETADRNLAAKAAAQFGVAKGAETLAAASEKTAHEATMAEAQARRDLEVTERHARDLKANSAAPAALPAAQTAEVAARKTWLDLKNAAEAARAAAEQCAATTRKAEAALRQAAPPEYEARQAARRTVETATGALLTAKLYSHALIKGLAQPHIAPITFRKITLPSYIPSRTLATALHDVIAPAGGALSLEELKSTVGTLPEQIRRPLLVFMREAQGDVDTLRLSLERWYEDAMQRVSGLYKRKTQLVVLAIATVMVLTLNADSIQFARDLSNDDALRASIVAQAESFVKMPPAEFEAYLKRTADSTAQASPTLPPTKSDPALTTKTAPPPTAPTTDSKSLAEARVELARKLIDSLGARGLSVGWPPLPDKMAFTDVVKARLVFGIRHLPGLLLTIIAVSLGAPFWFDVLNKVINIRAAGRAPEEKPKSPEVLPPARGA